MTPEEFANDRVFPMLGISAEDYQWQVNRDGMPYAWHGLFMTVHAMAKLGMLYLQYGRASMNDTIVNENFVLESTRGTDKDKGGYGYGYGLWSKEGDNKYPARATRYCAQGLIHNLICVDENLKRVLAIPSDNFPFLEHLQGGEEDYSSEALMNMMMQKEAECSFSDPQIEPPSCLPLRSQCSTAQQCCASHCKSGLCSNSPTCLSSRNTLEVLGKGETTMDKLEIGDFIRVANDKFEQVYSFGHFDASFKAEYLQIYTDIQQKPLEISKDHLLYVTDNFSQRSVPASLIKPGDKLVMGSGHNAQVTKIDKVLREGAFAPFTASGTLVANGMLVSSYITLQADSGVLVVGGYNTFLSMQWLAHLFQSPHRMLCKIAPGYCESETYNESGISNWVAAPLRVGQWFMSKNAIVMTMMFLPVFAFMLLIRALELITENAILFILGLMLLPSFVFVRTKASKTQVVESHAEQ